MGSYENIVKIEEMRKRMEEGDMASAQKVLDTMELKKIKNMSDLGLIAEVYAENDRYEEALQLYLKIYEKTKSRKSLFQIVDLSIKNLNMEDAKHYLNEYEKLAPRDFYKYIFRYKIDKQTGEPYATLIETLKTLKDAEYIEKWAYELAKVYYKAGMEKECIEECSDIILWFGEGVYVEKAKILRSYYSGEANKEMIMEELKRRAMEETTSSQDSEEQKDKAEPLAQREAENPDTSEGELYSGADFSVDEDTADFEDGLKKDIQNILTDTTESVEEKSESEETEETEEEETEQEDWEAETDVAEEETEQEDWEAETDVTEEYSYEAKSGEEITGYEAESADTETEESSPRQNLENETAIFARSEREVAEQEVEKALYQLLEDEDMDEDDKKLKQIAEDLEINQEEIFGNFLHVKSIKKQLVKSLEGILDVHTKTVQILITGTVGSGKTTLAKDITMFLYKAGKLKTSKIAKIKADKLNSIDIMTKKDTLKDCCLVVENASDLKRETIDSLLELCRSLRGNIAVIFEENKINMNKLFRECPKLMDLFKNRIHLPQYTQEDLMGFAYACLRQKDYRLNSKAEPILKHKINQIARQSEPHMHLEQIYNLMLEAMNAADIRTGKQLSNLASQGRLRDVDVLTVLSEDFVIKP